MTSDISAFIQPKSDQLNADDLIAGARVVEITGVRIIGGREQPVAIEIRDPQTGEELRPWKPCKTTMRVLAFGWETTDGAKWIGKLARLYRDPDVKFGGDAVGGIRVSGMSHIRGPFTIALSATRGKKATHKVEPIQRPEQRRQPTPDTTTDPFPKFADALRAKYALNPDDVCAYMANGNGPDPHTMSADYLRALFTDLAPGTERRQDFDRWMGGEVGEVGDDGGAQ